MVQIATEPSVLLSCVSFGIYSSMVPQLIVSKVCHSYYNNATTCKELSSGNYELEEKRVYNLAAKWNTACFAAISVPSLFTSLVVGALSGVLSKRKLLLLPPILLTIQAVILILCAKFISSSMVFVVLASGLTSIYGDGQGYSILLYSYMADVTRADQSRTVRMSALGGIGFLGLGLGSFVAGILLERYGFIIVFSFALATALANLVFVAFFLPETSQTLPDERNEETSKHEIAVPSLRSHVKTACMDLMMFFKTYLFSWKNKHVGFVLISSLFTQSALIGESVILVLFLKHTPLAMSPDQIGEFVLSLQCTTGIGVIVLAFISWKLYKPSDPGVIIVGQISVISTYLAIGLMKDKHAIFGVTPLAIAYSLPSAGLRSIITKLVQPSEASAALSCIAFVNIVSWVLMTFTCNELFRLTATFFPGMSLIMFAISCFLGLLSAIAAFLCNPKHHESSTSDLLLGTKDNYQTISKEN